MALTDEIRVWVSGAEVPTAERVAQLRQQWPTFLLPAVMRLRHAADLTDEERQELTTWLAMRAPDLAAMSMAADVALTEEFANFYPAAEPVCPSTESAIDKFINTYGTTDPREEELLTRLIFNPTPDYAQMLAREEEESAPTPDEAPEGTQDALLNNFIIKSKAVGGQFPSVEPEPEPEAPVEPPSPVAEPEVQDESLLSESLAQIYIRRGRYDKAYEIISNLNLNFPEKSIYFADQLRFLRKLMAVQERRSGTNKQ